jgi:hypothetical protein
MNEEPVRVLAQEPRRQRSNGRLFCGDQRWMNGLFCFLDARFFSLLCEDLTMNDIYYH